MNSKERDMGATNDNAKITPYLVWAVFLLGFLLRFSMINIPFIEDETKNLLVAKTISFSPDHLNLPMDDPYVRHPLLNLYATKLGTSLFGETKFGARIIHLVFGALTLVVVYFLAREMGEKEAVLAMFLLSVNQYHIHSSVRAENSSLLIFLAVLVMLIFFKSIKHRSPKMMLILGPVSGLMFLTKEASVLLLAALVLFLLVSAQQRFWFKTKEFYFSFILFLVVISPWICWVLTHGSHQLIFQPRMYDLSNLGPKRTAINFFLIEPIAWIQGVDYRLTASWEYAPIDGVSGIVLLYGVLASLRRALNDYHKMMLFVFFVIMGILTFFAHPGTKYGEFWWAQLVLIPAVCLTASASVRMSQKNRIYKGLLAMTVCYMAINAFFFIGRLETRISYPPRRFAAHVDDNLIVARFYRDRGMWDEAIIETKRLLALAPNDVDDHSFFGELYFKKGMLDEALAQWVRALEILPDYVSMYNELHLCLDQAVSKYQRKVQQDTNDIEARYFLGVLYYYNGMHDAALNELKKISGLRTDDQRANYYLGLIYNKKGDYSEAVDSLIKVTEGDSRHELAYYNLGINYMMLHDYDDAIKSFKRSLEINPDKAEAYRQLGAAYEKMGMAAESEHMRREAEKICLMI